jgi:ABC-type glycerol-3-phosphate transport system substrate-binding protein
MKSQRAMPQKINALIKEIKERRLIQSLFIYSIGAIGLLASVYEITEIDKIRRMFIILCIAGTPIVLIASYFHGKPGKDRVPFVEILLISICVFTGGGFALKTFMEPKPITILIRMMQHQENWFIENILREFEEKNHCKVVIKRFKNDQDLITILQSEGYEKSSDNVSLVKAPMFLTLGLYKEGFLDTFEDILMKQQFNKTKINSWLHKIEDEYDPISLKMSSFITITGKKLFFLPRKLETRLMIYRKSNVADAVKNWHKFAVQLNDILKKENGYGLPKNYNLESDVNKWDYYDVLVASYYWANTQYNGEMTARTAHRSLNYSGTVLGLIDRALQLGADQQDIHDMYGFSEAIIDLFHWEAIFRRYNLYSTEMWQGDGWSGSSIYEGIKKNRVFLAWMHQLDILLICGSEQMGIKGYLDNKEDLGFAIMPLGVSFELTEDGLVKRTGTRKAHTSGWLWGIPKNASEPDLALKLALFITGYKPHLEESKNFCLIPVRRDVHDALNADLKSNWKKNVYAKSTEQLRLNGENFVPKFKTLGDYQKFLNDYYDAFEEIIIKKRYRLEGPHARIDRVFISEYLK